MAQRGLYQPKIADEHIRQLYQWARRLQIPMTRLVVRDHRGTMRVTCE